MAPGMRWSGAAVVLLAGGLRLLRAGLRWDEIALAYAAYQQPVVQGIGQGGGAAWVGLHPPLYSWLFALIQGAWGAPAGWLLLSAALSTAAVALLVWRVHPMAALVLATDPFQLAYCAEVNNYALLGLGVAAVVVARVEVGRGRSVLWLAAAGALAGWSHLLGGWVAGVALLSLGPARLKSVALGLGALTVGCLPLISGAAPLLLEPGTRGQAGLELGVLWQHLWTLCGPWLLLLPLGVLPLLRLGAARPRWAYALLALSLVGVALALLLGVAASHQLPYWVVVGAPLSLALWRLAPWTTVLAASLGLFQVLPGELTRAQELRRNLQRTRAIDVALSSASPHAVIWLVSPAWQPDDDKTATSDVLWRFSPWQAMPPALTAVAYTDPRGGQPRWMGTHIVHSSTDLDAQALQTIIPAHLQRYEEIWFVLYDHGYADDYPGMLRARLAPYRSECSFVGADLGMGQDLLCVVRP